MQGIPQAKLLTFEEFSSLQPELLGQTPYPEGTSRWFKTVAAATLADEERPVFAVAFDELGRHRAVLPLALRGDGSLRSLTAAYTTRYSPALPDPRWAGFLGEQAASYVINTMRLDALDLDEPALQAYLAGVRKSRLAQVNFAHFGNWHETINDFATYWASRPNRLKQTVRRKLKAALQNHQLSFRLTNCADELAEALKDYLDVYSASWKEPEPYPHFIPTLIRELGADGSLRLGSLSVDGVVAAAQIWLVRGLRLTIFKLAHREQFASLSPGTILTHWLLQSACNEGATLEVDFGRGDDAYKRDWLKNRRMRHGSLIANWRSSRGLAALLSEIYPTRIANAVKRVPIGAHG